MQRPLLQKRQQHPQQRKRQHASTSSVVDTDSGTPRSDDFIVVDWLRRGIRAQSNEDENARFVFLVVDHYARGIAWK
jgi:hypothetical protein